MQIIVQVWHAPEIYLSMKDGKKIPPAREPKYPHELAGFGWWVFIIPKEKVDDVNDWLWNAICRRDVLIAKIEALNIILIRRHTDAILFKITWPECKRWEEDLMPNRSYISWNGLQIIYKYGW